MLKSDIAAARRAQRWVAVSQKRHRISACIRQSGHSFAGLTSADLKIAPCRAIFFDQFSGLPMTSRSVPSRNSAQEAAESIQFEPEFISGLREIFETRVAFNQTIGLKIGEITPTLVQGHIAMRPDLIGHSAYQRIHGGVISAGLDSMGGLAVMAAIAAKHMDDTPAQRLHRFSRLGTIDLRVDYMRPGIGKEFLLTARVLRLGSRVANTQMEFLSVDGELLSTGTAAYIVS
jgi:uncharacterized protein (TIGR00369 family)